jgi:hypothetical protein
MVEILYKHDICREADISLSTFERMREKGLIPLRVKGHRPCMTREALEDWLRNLPPDPKVMKVTERASA